MVIFVMRKGIIRHGQPNTIRLFLYKVWRGPKNSWLNTKDEC